MTAAPIGPPSFAYGAIGMATLLALFAASLFVGLVAPNVMSRFAGENLRLTLPWVEGGGAALVLACDIVGRLIRFPYEVPVGTVLGVVGALLFLVLLSRRDSNG